MTTGAAAVPGSSPREPEREPEPALPSRTPAWLRRGVVFVLVAVAGLQVSEWLFFNLKSFLGLLFLAWLFAISIEPVVNAMERRGTRRGLATGMVMFTMILAIVVFLAVFGALLVNQLAELVDALPGTVQTAIAWSNRTLGTTFRPDAVTSSLHLTPQRIQDLAQRFTPGVFGVLSKLMGLVFQGFTLLLFAFYMSAEGPQLRATLSRGFPPSTRRCCSTCGRSRSTRPAGTSSPG